MYSTEEENYVWPQDSCNINMPFQFISSFHRDKCYAISEGKLSIYVLTIWCEDWLVEYHAVHHKLEDQLQHFCVCPEDLKMSAALMFISY